VAAGAAMFIALVATVAQSRWYMINTWGFIIGATVIYMAKDRIKEWMRSFLSSRLTRWLADYSVKIRDPVTNAEIGHCRETFSYAKLDSVPADVLRLRLRDAQTSIDPLAKPEVAMRYEKDIRLRPAAISDRLHVEPYEINDIIRFAITHFRRSADDPMSVIAHYDAKEDRVRHRKFRKVYHLNVVMVIRSLSTPAAPMMRRIRVVFDRRGIRRLEDVNRDSSIGPETR